MVLESTIVCVDNSEWMRNGDFLPTRIQAQQDAVSIICHAKTRQNPENNVALMTSSSLEVLVTLTSDVGRILSKLHHVQPSGAPNFLTGIKIAHLALKHRQGKNHKMRIVVFVGSPLDAPEKELVKAAKKLKKEKVNVDIIALGEDSSTVEKLTHFVNTLNGKDGTGSHLVVVPPGPNLSDALRTSPVVHGEDGYTPASDGGFDVDPSIDPELALALRVSMEEQRQRQDEEAKQATSESKMDAGVPASSTGHQNTEEALLRNAISMSLGAPSALDFAAMSEEEQIALAIQMSMSDGSIAHATSAMSDSPSLPTGISPLPSSSVMETDGESREVAMDEDQDYSAVMSDPAFLQHLVGSLPGVDPNSEAIQSAVQALTQVHGKDESNDKKDDSKKGKEGQPK